MPAPHAITVAQLLRLIGTPDCSVIVDISIDADFDADPHLIPTAFRHSHTVIRAADTNAHHLAPEAAGLLAISVGLSRQYRDDLAQLEVGMQIYDALYRWARDGQGEGHDWPTGRTQ